MTMHKALHPRDDIERLYLPRKERGRAHTSTEDSDETSILRLEDLLKIVNLAVNVCLNLIGCFEIVPLAPAII